MSNIIIASWGNPYNWKKVRYQKDGSDEFTFAATLALAEILKVDYNNVIIFLPSSLYNEDNDTKDLENNIKNRVYKLICERHKDVKPRLFIVPSIGKFKTCELRFIFEGNAQSYHNSVYYNTLNILNTINTEDKNVDVHLDITHGINYMPVMCSEAVRLAANTYAAAKDKIVKVITYNSDPLYPLPNKDDKNTILTINEISQNTYGGYKSLLQLLMLFVTDYKINKNIYCNNILKLLNNIIGNDNKIINSEDLEKIYKIAKSVSAGLLLTLPYTYNDIINYQEISNNVLKKISTISNNNICRNNNEVTIKHEKSSERIALLHSILFSLRSIDLISYNENKLIEISIKSLENSLKRYYKGVLDSVYYIVSEELDKINKLSNNIDNTYKLYAEINNKDYGKTKEGKTSSRILYAHAGLEENVTYLKRSGNDILISYCNYFNNIFQNI
jgi:CRISPR-associated protein Csx1